MQIKFIIEKLSIIHKLKQIALITLITFVLWEVVLAIYVHAANLRIGIPTYTFRTSKGFWFDINKDFGSAHFPNDTYQHKKTCFNIVYTTNSHGFRDKERVKEGKKNRVVVLGDSFMEGYGIEPNHRLSNVLETERRIPHLNFGISGNFGPTQYYILYKTLASQYTHDAVLVGVLPSNDFVDDDYEVAVEVEAKRYKPFFVGEYPNYDLVYYQDSLHKSVTIPSRQKQSVFRMLAKNFTYTYNMLGYIKARLQIQKMYTGKPFHHFQAPSYLDYTAGNFNRMKYALEKIKELAGERPVMVFTIPTIGEIQIYRKYKKNPLGKALASFSKEKGIEYLDLLPLTDSLSLEQCEELFLPCDGHWNKKGNLFAKQHIERVFSYYQ